MTKEQRTAMAQIISDMIKADISLATLHRHQHFFPSLHGNVAVSTALFCHLCMAMLPY